MMTRRQLITAGLAGTAAAITATWRTRHVDAAPAFEVTHTDAEWKKLLTPNQYAVLRHEATERPFSSPLLHEERRGTFACAGCDLDLFSSTTKFDSRTGWPSFWAPLDKAVITARDFSAGMDRTAVSCRRCGGHQGHVFDDGPKPTGLRYCMNGVAMTFKPATTDARGAVMILFALVYLGGVLTIISPCILPVLPFVFARADRPFVRSGLPLLLGMAATFAVVASLAAVGGGWAVSANQYGRGVALALLAFFGITLLLPGVAARLMQPLVALGARLSRAADLTGATGESSVASSLVLGVATGLLWAPCAGPVLGLILTGAALQGASARTTFLLLAFAAGSATSLALALLIGGRVFAALKQSLGVGEWIRRAAGAAILAAVVAIALGVDTGFLTRVSLSGTSSLEQRLLDALHPAAAAAAPSSAAMMMKAKAAGGPEELTVEGTIPPLSGGTEWLNSPPLTAEGLRGKVVLVDFWTYSCINCLRAIPYVRAWAEKYAAQGLVVIGVHTPEFAFEKNIGNVRKAVADLGVAYPVAIDNDYAIWRAFKNEYWPAHYFIDASGRIRHHHFGEGDYDGSERVIRQLLTEAGTAMSRTELVSVHATGAQASPDLKDVLSPETYVGYGRAEHFVSPGGAVPDRRHSYAAGMPGLNEWGLSGFWTIRDEDARLDEKDGRIVYRFHARDLHLVLGPTAIGTSVRFRVMIDGAAPGESHGTDVDAEGNGVVNEQRLYQLIRQTGLVNDHTFEIRFLTPGVQVYAFTFG